MAVSRTIFDVIEREGLLSHAAELGEWAMGRLGKEPKIAGKIAAVRGRGLMIGVELKEPIEKVVEKAQQRGIIINLTAQKVIRLAPAVNISRSLLSEGLDALIETIATGT
jgi:acetylornithine/succinyldiaminopimelate/putrescine aminotransferase